MDEDIALTPLEQDVANTGNYHYKAAAAIYEVFCTLVDSNNGYPRVGCVQTNRGLPPLEEVSKAPDGEVILSLSRSRVAPFLDTIQHYITSGHIAQLTQAEFMAYRPVSDDLP